MSVGILGLQGDYAAHHSLLEGLKAEVQIVKKPDHLDLVDSLVIPGGESTTLIKLMNTYGFWEPLRAFSLSGKPILGTCAGMILLASQVLNPPQKSLGMIDLMVERNSYGRQRQSFEATGSFSPNGRVKKLHMVFIRAPRIRRLGAGVECLATCRDDCVLARQANVLVASFHPELTDDPAVHKYFLNMA